MPIRHAVEIRHESFAVPEFIALLRKNKIALVVADTPEWPCLMDVTADFVYCRLHGSKKLYASGYDAAAIETWARRVVAWSHGKEVTDGTKVHPKPAAKTIIARCVYLLRQRRQGARTGGCQSLMKKIAELKEKSR